jgi:hypothetical protein
MATNVIIGIQNVRPPVTAVTWTIPENVLFRPPYKRERALRYVQDKLTHGGFRVEVRNEYTLDIDWTPVKRKKRRARQPVDRSRRNHKRTSKKEDPC